MTLLSINNYKLDQMPLLVRNSVINFLGQHQNIALRMTCKTLLDDVEKAKKKSMDPDLLPIDEVVHRVIAGNYLASPSDENLYLGFEKLLRVLKEVRKEEPNYLHEEYSYEAIGGLNPLMSSKEIEVYVQKKFDDLRKSGILLYRSEFEKQENPEKFRNPGNFGAGSQKLDRLWGAEYLREKLQNTEKYKVPRFFIVIKDHVKTLPIKLRSYLGDFSISRIETPDAELLVENITPSIPVGRDFCHRWMTQIGYVDYSDSGNILQGKDGNYYVVDTEWKSLNGCKDLRKDQNIDAFKFRNYITNRFKIFNPLDSLLKIELYK